jgi:hypothetical protein
MRSLIFGCLLLCFTAVIGCYGEPIGKQAGRSGQGAQEEEEEVVDDPKTHGVKVVLGKYIQEKGAKLNDYRIEPGEQNLYTKVFANITFEKRMNRKIIATAFDPKGAEYTQILIDVTIPAGETKTLEFAFDPRLELMPKSKVVLNIADAPQKDKKK